MRFLAPVVAASIILAVDQASKAAAIGGGWPVHFNRRGAFGSFVTPRVLLAVWVAATAAAAWIITHSDFAHPVAASAGLGAATGGAAGNLIDRFRHGAVVDFITGPRAPAFNLADVAILCGISTAALAST